jgi:hypothetical protein
MKFFVLTTGGKIAEFVNLADARVFALAASMVAKNRGQWYEVWGDDLRHRGTFIDGRVTYFEVTYFEGDTK